MFKRYKNPLEKEVSNTSFESKQGGGSVGSVGMSQRKAGDGQGLRQAGDKKGWVGA